MKRARLNLLIDAVIGIAFLATAVTGIVFLLPLSWQDALGVGASFHTWHWLHDWSGVVAVAGVVLHVVLHWRWVVHTTRRWLADWRGEQPAVTPRAAVSPAAAPQAAGPPAATPRAAAPASAPRITRRGLLVGAAGFATALTGGFVLSRIASAADHTPTTTSSGSTGQGETTPGSAGASSNGSSGSSSAGATGSATTTTQARVVVDSSSCTACGRCLQICPESVFAWGGDGRATAQSPDRCILCRRCVQVCPASAITLNA